MKRRIITLAMTLVMVFAMSAVIANAETCSHKVFGYNPTVIEKGTCSKLGTTRVYCACGQYYDDLYGKAYTTSDAALIQMNRANHSSKDTIIKKEIQPATCKAGALIEEYCDDCKNQQYAYQYRDTEKAACSPTGLVSQQYLKSGATCKSGPIYYQACKWCYAVLKDAPTFEYGNKTGHSPQKIDCETYECTVCHVKLGTNGSHKWTGITCTGLTCSNCTATKAAEGHKWVDATCKAPKTCSVCKATEGTVAAHTEVVVPGKAATTTSTGLTDGKKCSVCQTVTVAQQEIAKLPAADVTPSPAPTPDTGNNESVDPAPEQKPATVAIKSVKLAKTSVIYTGKAQKVKVTVKDANGKVVSAANYTVTYKNNVKVGKATVTVKGKGNYTGTKTVTFKINPKAPTIKKPVAAKKTMTVKWSKVSKEATGYEVMYATKKNFKQGKKTVVIKKAKTTSAKIKKLKSKKTYYVKVRTYKTVKGVKYYSAWSKVQNVKVK